MRWWNLISAVLFCHSTMGLTHCYRTAVFYIHICSFSTSVHSWDTTTSRFENKRRPCWNSTSGFDFQLFIVIGVWFCTDLPNFIRKSQRRYISPTCGEALTEPIWTEIWTFVVVPRVIMCSKFWTEIFRGYDFTGGRTFGFPIDYCMGLTTVQRYCAGCD